MSLRRKMRAIVALAAAYAVALQATFLAIGGIVSGLPGLGAHYGPSLGATSLCMSSRLGTAHPGPSGQEHDCSAACAACCCGAPAVPPSAAAAAYEKVPEDLLEQLKPTGRLIMPLGSAEDQQLTLVIKDAAGPIRKREILPVRFSRLETFI